MLFASGRNTRRLLLPGDEIHAERTGKIFPDASEVPERYLPLLEWAKQRFNTFRQSPGRPSPPPTQRVNQTVPHKNRLQELLDAKGIGIDAGAKTNQETLVSAIGDGPRVWLGKLLKLRLAGAHLADGVDPDEHIRELREGWD